MCEEELVYVNREDLENLIEEHEQLKEDYWQLKNELKDFKKLVYSFENITDLSNWQQDYENKELKE